jgi:hypothetical protein
MKTCFSLLLAALCALANVASLHAQSTAFTYQGRLHQGGAPAAGVFGLQFGLFAAPSGGTPLGGVVTHSAVGVTNGVFTVSLDFGASVFGGQDRWLAIAVRPAGNGNFTPLSPRQPITPTPYALTALSAFSVPGVTGHSLSAADGQPSSALVLDDEGRAGLGTLTPAAQLHIVSQPNEFLPPRLQSSGNNRFNAGWDFYHGGTGKGYVGVPDAGAPLAPARWCSLAGRA